MSCRSNYDPCLDGKLNQIGSYAAAARSSAQNSAASAEQSEDFSQASATSASQSATSATNAATSATNSQNSANDSANSAAASAALFASATSSNTPNTIVKRSANGAFAAGVITSDGIPFGKGGGTISSNIAIGINALTSNTTGSGNTANGENALTSNINGSFNTAIGSLSLESNTSGLSNVAIGRSALRVSNGSSNTAVGVTSLRENTTGLENTAIGYQSGYSNITGNQNTAIGNDALYANTAFSNCSGLGNNSAVTGSNQVQLGNSSTTTYTYGAVQDRSDIRDKADVRDTELGLEFVNALRPVDFKWDIREDYRPEAQEPPPEDASDEEKAAYEVAKAKWLEDVKLSNIIHNGSKKRNRYHHGLIAQEVKAVIDAKGIDFGGFQDHSLKGGDDVLSIGYNELIAPLIKAIQELSAKIEILESK
jgi:hypothetical protein